MIERDIRLTYNIARTGDKLETHFFDFKNNARSRMFLYSEEEFLKLCHQMERTWTSMFPLVIEDGDQMNVRFISINVDCRSSKGVTPSEDEIESSEKISREIYEYLLGYRVFAFMAVDGFGHEILIPVDVVFNKNNILAFESMMSWLQLELIHKFKCAGKISVRPCGNDNKARVIGTKTNYANVPGDRKRITSKWLEIPSLTFKPNVVLSVNISNASKFGAKKPKKVLESFVSTTWAGRNVRRRID